MYQSRPCRNPAIPAALESQMAEQNFVKRGQAPGTDPHQQTGTVSRRPTEQRQHDPLPLDPDPGTSVACAMMEPDLQAHIGRQLKAVYEEVVSEAVPDRFLKLLQTLESDQTGESKEAGEHAPASRS
jgi:hypothetical protein